MQNNNKQNHGGPAFRSLVYRLLMLWSLQFAQSIAFQNVRCNPLVGYEINYLGPDKRFLKIKDIDQSRK